MWQALGEEKAEARAEVADVLPQLENLYGLYKLLARRARSAARSTSIRREVNSVWRPRQDRADRAAQRNDAHKLIEECMLAANVWAAEFLESTSFRGCIACTRRRRKSTRTCAVPARVRAAHAAAAQGEAGDYAALMAQDPRPRPTRECSSRCCCARNRRRCTARTTSATSVWRSRPMRTSRARFAAIPTCSCIARSTRCSGGKPADYTYSASAMAALAMHCSQNERRADEASRDVDERFKCAWMDKHVGSEFDGMVTGVTSFGLFVELTESQVSGPGACHPACQRLLPLRRDPEPTERRTHGRQSALATRCACRCCARAWRIARSISGWCSGWGGEQVETGFVYPVGEKAANERSARMLFGGEEKRDFRPIFDWSRGTFPRCAGAGTGEGAAHWNPSPA